MKTSIVRKWFGEDPWIENLQEKDRVPVPVGKTCTYCDEEIKGDDSGALVRSVTLPESGPPSWEVEPLHAECMIRIVVGSVAHLQKRCPCYGGPPDELPDGMTRHHEALLVVALLGRRGEKWNRSLN